MRTPRGVVCDDCGQKVMWGIEIPPQSPYSSVPKIAGYCDCSTSGACRVWLKIFGQRLTWVQYPPENSSYGNPYRNVDPVMFQSVMGRSMADEEISWYISNMTDSDCEVSWFEKFPVGKRPIDLLKVLAGKYNEFSRRGVVRPGLEKIITEVRTELAAIHGV